MDFIMMLWQPILLSAVIVHVASAIVWMASPLHRHDYKSPGDKEKNILDLIRTCALAPGVYMVPWCTHGQRTPEMLEKYNQGPWAQLVVMSKPSMGRSMGLWILNLVLVGILVAYVASHALPHGAPYLKVFQIVGATTFLAYAGNSLTLSIWMGMPWTQVPGRIADGLIYGLLTGGTFAWLWPKAAAITGA